MLYLIKAVCSAGGYMDKKKLLNIFLLGASLLFFFQNCGEKKSNSATISSMENSEFDAMVTFGDDKNMHSQGAEISAATTTSSPQLVHSSILVVDSASQPSFNLYGTEIARNKIYMGGWASESNIGSDLLYSANVQFQAGVPTLTGQLQPLRWSNAGYTPGIIPGYHVNDASVIDAPNNSWMFMYYTVLENRHGGTESQNYKNWLGFASSTDGGFTWQNHGPIIRQNNGINNGGAWAPSAIKESNHVRLYYHTGYKNCLSDSDPCLGNRNPLPAQVLMSRMNNNGWGRLSTHIIRDRQGRVLSLTNVDVIKTASNKYYLVGSTPDLLEIRLYESTDGLVFNAVGNGRVARTQAGYWLTTPHLRAISSNVLEIAFSFHSPTSYGFPMAKSTHAWRVRVP